MCPGHICLWAWLKRVNRANALLCKYENIEKYLLRNI